MDEFLAAIDHAKLRTGPDPDGATCEVFNNADGAPLRLPLHLLNAT